MVWFLALLSLDLQGVFVMTRLPPDLYALLALLHSVFVMLYLIVLFLEFSPMALEWLGQRKLRRVLVRLTLLLTIFGITLSTMHQSSLGALFLIVPSKLHPLWYSSYLPVFFFVSSVAAGLSMVIFEGTLAHRGFADKMDEEHKRTADGVVLGFGKAAAFVLAAYFAIKTFGVALDDNWGLLATNYGLWFLLEMIGFVALPCFLYVVGVRDLNLTHVFTADHHFAVVPAYHQSYFKSQVNKVFVEDSPYA